MGERQYNYISRLVSKYSNYGIESVIENNYKGNHRNLSYEQEEKLLQPFLAKAEVGQVVEIKEIKKTYEQAVGNTESKSNGHIYAILRRHGFRRVLPRSKHPNKASEEVIETSKKLTT